jgi:hypothetical protein
LATIYDFHRSVQRTQVEGQILEVRLKKVGWHLLTGSFAFSDL